jgi:peptide chain release factor 1
LAAELDQVEAGLADPSIHADQTAARKLGRRYAQLRPLVASYREWRTLTDDLEAAQEFAAEDASFAAEVETLEAAQLVAAERLTALLLPRDPMDDKDVIVEIKAGEGGD